MKILAHYSDYDYTPERRKLDTFGPLGYYRIVAPAQQIDGHEVTIIGKKIGNFGTSLVDQWKDVFEQYDVFWTGYFADEKVASAMFYWAQRLGKKVIIDIDDNYYDIPQSNDLYERFKPGKRDRAMLGTVLSLADAITVSTYPLKEKVAQHIKLLHGIDKPIYVVPNCNDIKFWKQTVKPQKDDSKFVIGYSGSTSHEDDLRMVMPAIAKIMKKYPQVHLNIIGTISKDKVHRYFDKMGFSKEILDKRVWLGPAETIFKKLPEWLGQQPWDVGLAPLVDTPFTRCKSHIKWMEYSMFEIPTLASRVYPYFMPIKGKKIIEDGVTGMLARSNEWFDKLEMLILDEKLRKQLGKNAKKAVTKEWQYKDSNISETINKMLSDISGDPKSE